MGGELARHSSQDLSMLEHKACKPAYTRGVTCRQFDDCVPLYQVCCLVCCLALQAVPARALRPAARCRTFMSAALRTVLHSLPACGSWGLRSPGSSSSSRHYSNSGKTLSISSSALSTDMLQVSPVRVQLKYQRHHQCSTLHSMCLAVMKQTPAECMAPARWLNVRSRAVLQMRDAVRTREGSSNATTCRQLGCLCLQGLR